MIGTLDRTRDRTRDLAYLAHVRRYGRVPRKSALILLALNFQTRNPGQIFAAAAVDEPWPYDPPLALSSEEAATPGILSVRINSDAFLHAVKDIIRSEVRPQSTAERLQGKALMFGMNHLKEWLFKDLPRPGKQGAIEGFMSEFSDLLAVSLHATIETSVVEYAEYAGRMARGGLDLFGPVVTAPNLPPGTVFSKALYRVGMSALMRMRKVADLESLPNPDSVTDLIKRPYTIAVIKNSRAHLLARSRLKRRDEDLVICRSPEEAFQSIAFRGSARPAHLFVCNSIDAIMWSKEHPREMKPVLYHPGKLIDMADTGIAVREEWPELLKQVNSLIDFLQSTGALADSFERWAPKGLDGLYEVV